MGGRVVAGRGNALAFLDNELHFLVGQDLAAADLDLVHDERRCRLQGVHDPGRTRGGLHPARVAHLTAGLAVERRLQGDHETCSLGQTLHGLPFGVEQGHDATGSIQAVVPDELRLQAAAHEGRKLSGQPLVAGTGPGVLGLLLLHGHVLAEAVLIHAEALLLGDVVDDIERESVGVVQLESRLAGDGPVAVSGQGLHFVLENAQALVQGLAETLLLLPHHADHEILACYEFREMSRPSRPRPGPWCRRGKVH